MRTFVIGDIHGRHKALKQVLDKSKFDYDNDKLIVLGDIVDGGIDTYKVVEELLKIKNIIFILGNHDEWWMNHISSGWTEQIWINQGGANTLNSYGGDVIPGKSIYHEPIRIDTRGVKIPQTHIDFFNTAVFYHVENNMLFVHGGIDPNKPLQEQDKELLLWDRNLIDVAASQPIEGYDKIFVGHTTTESTDNMMEPVIKNNLIMMDCGAGWTGKLAITDIESGAVWLSDKQKPYIRK